MKIKTGICARLGYGLFFFCAFGLALHGQAATKSAEFGGYNCSADSSWFTAPSMPTEVKKSAEDGTSNFCDFYQFSWQAFAYLMSPSASNSDIRNFEDISQYPELEINADGSPANSCDETANGHTLFIRVTKTDDPGDPFVIPERIGQAGGGATIYDQNRNVVYYDVRFSKSLCDFETIKAVDNFPGGTTELKMAWKVLTPADDAGQYITMDAKIGSEESTTKLGLIGFHVAVATPDHPEFVWSTFEHDVNTPYCTNPSRTTGWSFASEQCTADLQGKDVLGVVQCRFNHPSAQTDPTKVTGNPTEICREYPYGSAEGDLKYAENVGDIRSLNANVQPYLTGAYGVLTNYFNVGALWVSDIRKGSVIDNQRGSLRLANTVAETEYQNVDLEAGFVSNCFGCHNYKGTGNPAAGKNTTAGSLSHIFDDIAIGAGQCLDVQAARVINNQAAAESTCPKTCTGSSSQFRWNGQWTNTDAETGRQLPMTVCGCCGAK